MTIKIIGEALSIVSTMLELYERSLKTYKKSIRTSIVRYVIQDTAQMLLVSFNGAVVTLMAIVRYLFMYKKKFAGKIIGGSCFNVDKSLFCREYN